MPLLIYLLPKKGYLFGHMDDQDMMTAISGNPDYMEDDADDDDEENTRGLGEMDEIREKIYPKFDDDEEED